MQTEKITLPEHPDKPGEEQWAEIRSTTELRSGDVKAMRGAVRLKLGDDGTIDKSFSMADDYARKDALLRRLIVQWSLPEPHPQAEPEVLDELPFDIYEALLEAIAPHAEALDFKDPKPKEGGGDSSG